MKSEKIDLQKGFGEIIRNKRLEMKIGLRQFAEKVALSPTFISKMEVGEFKPPKEENIKKIAKILNLDIDLLMAKADKLSSDLKNIINKEPELFASFLRKASNKKDLKEYLTKFNDS
ncbi:MAG: transcriptional regulator with XRE-family HTH domain [Rickettsiales bacterium]|jgi:transcriptional regulator with XRE-family HTH domain